MDDMEATVRLGAHQPVQSLKLAPEGVVVQ
jgi:hypothetical protein